MVLLTKQLEPNSMINKSTKRKIDRFFIVLSCVMEFFLHALYFPLGLIIDDISSIYLLRKFLMIYGLITLLMCCFKRVVGIGMLFVLLVAIIIAYIINFKWAVYFYFSRIKIRRRKEYYEERRKNADTETRDYEQYKENYGDEISFDGLTKQEAKEKYRELLKKYHPDNEDGDIDKTRAIITAYRRYRAANSERNS